MEIAEEWLALERDVLGQRPLISGTVEYVRAAYEATSQQLGALYPPPEAYDVKDGMYGYQKVPFNGDMLS